MSTVFLATLGLISTFTAEEACGKIYQVRNVIPMFTDAITSANFKSRCISEVKDGCTAADLKKIYDLSKGKALISPSKKCDDALLGVLKELSIE